MSGENSSNRQASRTERPAKRVNCRSITRRPRRERRSSSSCRYPRSTPVRSADVSRRAKNATNIFSRSRSCISNSACSSTDKSNPSQTAIMRISRRRTPGASRSSSLGRISSVMPGAAMMPTVCCARRRLRPSCKTRSPSVDSRAKSCPARSAIAKSLSASGRVTSSGPAPMFK